MYCNSDDTKVQISYKFGDGTSRVKMVEGIVPISVTVDAIGKKQFHSEGSAPINYTAPGDITGITCTGTFRQIGNDASTELPCSYILDHSVITGNTWEANYDSTYIDNSGDMNFDISYLADLCFIRVRDTSGRLIFKDSGQCPITFDVKCIKQHCPEGYCECHTDEYPGYCCSDCADTASQIHSMTTQLRSINGK